MRSANLAVNENGLCALRCEPSLSLAEWALRAGQAKFN
jgi:hypothetical protein